MGTIPTINLISLNQLKKNICGGLENGYEPTPEQLQKYKKIEVIYEKSRELVNEAKYGAKQAKTAVVVRALDVIDGTI